MVEPWPVPIEVRAKAIFAVLMGMGIGGFLFLCVSASTCGACYVDPCVHPPGLKTLYKVNSSLCFAGATTGMFFCFLSGWGTLLTLRRRASVMGFGHFFGATCVTFLVAVQSAGMWGAEASLLEAFARKDIYEDAIIGGAYEHVHIKPNKALYRACKFLFSVAVLISIGLMTLAPLYFVSRDVYEEDSLSANMRRRRVGFQISPYDPVGQNAPADDERQYLGRASIPMRNIRPQYKQIPDTTAATSTEIV